MTCGISRGEWALLDMRQRLKVAAEHVKKLAARKALARAQAAEAEAEAAAVGGGTGGEEVR